MEPDKVLRKPANRRHWKGGRTKSMPGMRVDEATLTKFHLLLDATGETAADWITKRIEEAYIEWIKNA